MREEKDEIAKILEDYQKQRESKNNGTQPDAPLPPPVRREEVIDFARKEEKQEEKRKPKKPEKTPEEIEQEKQKRLERKEKAKKTALSILKKIKAVLFNKITLIAVIVIAVAIGLFFGIREIVHLSSVAYLKPYEQKYDIEFPEGMLEKYCDYYGENQSTTGFLEIGDIKFSSPVYDKASEQYPKSEQPREHAKQGNFVIYLDSKELETVYATAEGYNKASAVIQYSDLFNEYSFKVVGSFYTNINTYDDNGYVFPYNTPEEMSDDSRITMCNKVQSRFIYDTGLTLTRNDKMIFISCPTDFKKDFRFVVVGVMRENTDTKLTAKERDDTHYPQAVYDDKKQNNPYRLAGPWYPEIVITNGEQEEYITLQESDYSFKHPKLDK